MVTEVCRILVVNSESSKEVIGRRYNFLSFIPRNAHFQLRPNISSFQNLHEITLNCSLFKFMKVFHIKSITRTHHTPEGETKFHSTPINKYLRWIPYYEALQAFFLISPLTPCLSGLLCAEDCKVINTLLISGGLQ